MRRSSAMWGAVTNAVGNAVGAAKAATSVIGNATYTAAATYFYPPTSGDVQNPDSGLNTPPVATQSNQPEEFSKDQKRVQEALEFLKEHCYKFQKSRFEGIIDDLNIILNDICKLQEEEKLNFQQTGQVVRLSEVHINLQIQQLHSKYKFKALGDTEKRLRTYLTKFSRNQSLELQASAPMIDVPKKKILDQVVEKFALAFSHYFFKRTGKICDDRSFFEKEYYKINIFIQWIKENPEQQRGEDSIEKIVGSFADFPLAGACALRDAFRLLRSVILMSIGSEEVDKLEDEIDSIRALVTNMVMLNSIKISDNDRISATNAVLSVKRRKKKKKQPRDIEIKDSAETWQAPGIRQEDFENSEQALDFIQRVCASNQECDDKNLVKFACAIQNNLFVPDNNDAISIFLQLIREEKIKDSHAIYRFVSAITSTETNGNISYFHQVFAELIFNGKVMIPIVHEIFSSAISDDKVEDQNAICFFAKAILSGIVSRESANKFIIYFLEKYRNGKNIISINTPSGEHLSDLFLRYANGDRTVFNESDFFPLSASGRTSRASSMGSTHSVPSSIPSSRSATPVPEAVEVERTAILEPVEEVEEVEIERREETDAEKAWRLGTEPEDSVFNNTEYEAFSAKIEAGEITDWNVIKAFSKAFFDQQTIFKKNSSLTFRFLSFLIKKIDREEEWDETQKSVLKKNINDTLKNCLIEFSNQIHSGTHTNAIEIFVDLLGNVNQSTFPIRQTYLSFIEKIASGDIFEYNIIVQFSEVFLDKEGKIKNPIAFDVEVLQKLIDCIGKKIEDSHSITSSLPTETRRSFQILHDKLKEQKIKTTLLNENLKRYKNSKDNLMIKHLQKIRRTRNFAEQEVLKKHHQEAVNLRMKTQYDRKITPVNSLLELVSGEYTKLQEILNPPQKSRWQRTKEFFSNLLPSFRRAHA